MKKKYSGLLLFFPLLVVLGQASAQANAAPSLKQNPGDTNEVRRLINKAGTFRFSKPDSSLILAKDALALAQRLNYSWGECNALITLGEDWRLGGDFPQALESLFRALQISRDIDDEAVEASCLGFIGIAYADLGEYRQGLRYLFMAKELNEKLSIAIMYSFGLSNIGFAYEELNILDSALLFEEEALHIQSTIKGDPRTGPLNSLILRRLGNVQNRLGNYDKAVSYYRQVIGRNDLLNTGSSQYKIAEYFFTIKNNTDSSLYYALLSFNNGQRSFQKGAVLDASKLLAKIYKTKNQLDSANYYYETAMEIKDSLFGPEKFHKLQLLAINEQQRQQDIRQEKENFKNRIKVYVLLGIVGVFLLLAIIFYRNNRQKQRANKILEDTLTNLKATQSQLIQSEKMASLGELTAGIAHEIQNPLNFVNNFSEVNEELVKELKNEAGKGNLEEVKAIANDIAFNSEKINHHGKRADAIVKGMLQHSRTSSGQKEPTDINALAGEYLRLAYHGFRAKDKSFNADLKTDFDDSIGKISVIPQDMGRVILNLITNAFYVVDEKKKQNSNGYEPTVSVSTKKTNGKVEIKVADNGNGIPAKVLDKIFQPFFTTKPTGQGTGLGLSLSYDIVKAHGGELKVETKEGEGSEFIIQLPNQSS